MRTIAEAMHQQPGFGGEVAPVELSPEEAAQREQEAKQQREVALNRLDTLGQSLAKTRAEAIQARMTSGIEDEWLEDEEFYQGIDNANQGEHKTTWRKKPPGQAQATAEAGTAKTRSTVFPNITGPYVDSAAARIADMLLPTDDRSWSLGPTPVPSMGDISKGKYPQGMMKEAAALFPSEPKKAEHHLALATKAALEVIAEAKAKADKAQTRIEDWHVECQWHAQVRLVIEDAARIGTGVLKGPIPVKKTRTLWKDGKRQKVSEIKPGSKWIDPWNFYPDPACGENIHNGSYTWERDHLTKKQLRELLDQEGYVPEQIQRCLEEGAQRATGEYKPTPDALPENESKDKFEVWYFHGTAEREDLEAAGCDCEGVEDPHVPAMIVMVNQRVIKAVMNPLDTGEFPYDVMVWRRRSGYWTGQGVARQIRTAQRIVTAATRNLMDNAGLAAGPMLVFRQGVVYPADGGAARVAPRLIYYIAEEAEGMDDATKAIGQIKVDMLVAELLQVIQFGLNLAEQTTGLPMLLQGQMGKAPDTLGGMQMLNNNASATLRRLARLFDDRITEPHVRRYYDWLLDYGEDDEKGDYCIDARGSSALVERDIQNQAIGQMGNLILDPRFGKDPKKWMDEYLKSQRLDPARFAFDDEKWQQVVENMAKGPQDPRLAVAELRAQVDGQLLQLEQAFEARENDKDRAFQAWLAELEQQGTKQVSLTDLKGKLADTTIKIGAQERISARSTAAKQVAKPAVEPAGRAAPGKAFQH